MKTPKTIYSIESIKRGLKEARDKNANHYIYLKLALATALRASDLCQIQVKHINNSAITLVESKTGKTKYIELDNSTTQEVREYIAMNDLKVNDYIIASQKSKHKTPTTRRYLNTIIKRYFGEEYSTHSTRKSTAYHIYKTNNNNIALAMQVLNHSNPATTLKYIGETSRVITASLSRLYA